MICVLFSHILTYFQRISLVKLYKTRSDVTVMRGWIFEFWAQNFIQRYLFYNYENPSITGTEVCVTSRSRSRNTAHSEPTPVSIPVPHLSARCIELSVPSYCPMLLDFPPHSAVRDAAATLCSARVFPKGLYKRDNIHKPHGTAVSKLQRAKCRTAGLIMDHS
jgi:hypothetical protein